jgi:uncharacterized repeat protein (TIGR02543 family)
MPGRKRSGLARDRRAYTWSNETPWLTITKFTITYNGNTNTGGNGPTDGSSPYTPGSTVTILGNTGSSVFAKTGFTFSGWNTAANGSGTSYSSGNTFAIRANTILYAQWVAIPPVSTPTELFGVGGNQAAYILFTQSGSVTNYEYSTDNGATFLAFNPPQIYSPVEINTLSSDGVTRLTNETVYTVRLRAVNSDAKSNDSDPVNVTPTVTSLIATNRVIYLDANDAGSYSGSGTTWTNLESGGAYNATLIGTPTFDSTTTPGNKYFDFNRGTATGQYAQITQATAINPVVNQPFTIQIWARINNVGTQGTLVSKMFGQPQDYDGYNLTYLANTSLQLHMNGSTRDNRFPSATGVLSSGWVLYTANVNFGNGGDRQNKIFVNGRQVMTATSSESNITHPGQNMTFPAGFGGDGECDVGQFLYYNTELSVTQVIQNYDASKPRYI